MKIGIITYHNAYNYGSMLQTYALNLFLRQHNFDVKTIDYRPAGQDLYRRLFEPYHSLLGGARNLYSMLYLRSGLRKRERFDSFFKEFVPATPLFRTQKELKRLCTEYDCFICGSDQIWNQNCTGFDSSYFLDFVDDKRKCIAYAASTGGVPYTIHQEQELQRTVPSFFAISMREQSGSLIVEKATGRTVPTVLDPTCLISRDDWEALLPKNKKTLRKPYIFCYFIGSVPGMRQWAKILRRKTGLELVVVNRSLRDIGLHAKVRYDAGPREWLELLKNASYVCTDSFHAMVFSLIFQKNFWVFVKPEQFDDPGTRVRHLGRLLGCESRILSSEHLPNKCDEPVDFIKIAPRFKAEIDKSADWLLKNLTGVK